MSRTDYTHDIPASILVPADALKASVMVTITPIDDGVAEPAETIRINAEGSSEYFAFPYRSVYLTLEDSSTPYVTRVSTVSDPSVNLVGDWLSFTIRFNRGVSIMSGTPTLTLDVGGVPRTGTCWTSYPYLVWSCRYFVQFGDVDLDGVSISSANALRAAGAQFADRDGNPLEEVDTTLPAEAVKTYSVLRVHGGVRSFEFVISRASVQEGIGRTQITITATQDVGSSTPDVTHMIPITFTNLTTSADDYRVSGPQTITVPAGQRFGTAVVTVEPVEDFIKENRTETVRIGGGQPFYVTGADLRIIDAPSIELSVDRASIAENGGAQTVTVTAALGDASDQVRPRPIPVTLTPAGTARFGSGDYDDYTVPEELVVTIAPNARSGTAALTFTPVDDKLLEGDETIALRGATPGLTVSGAEMTLADDETEPEVVLSLSEETIVENETDATAVTVTARLDPSVMVSEATHVELTSLSGTATEATDYTAAWSPAHRRITIPAMQYAGANSVTLRLTPRQDDVFEGDETIVVQGRAVVQNAARDELVVQVATVTLADDDEPGVVVEPTALEIAEGGSKTYTVVLATEPTGEVAVTVSGATGEVSVSPPNLTFTPDTWDTPQEIEVSAAEDDDALADEAVTLMHVVSGADYGDVTAADVTVTIVENDEPAVTVRPTALEIAEGGEGTYTVVLDTEPAGNVTVAVAVPEDTDVSVAGSPLTFTPQTWNEAQTVTVSAAEDDDAVTDPAVPLTHAVSGGDYDNVTADDVTVTIRENDEPAVTVRPTALEITEGASGTYTVVLDTEPAADVTVTVNGASGDVGVRGSPLTFTPLNWNEAQTVTVDAAEDDDATPDATVTLTHAVGGGDYGAVTAADVTVTIRENDEPGVTVSPTALEIEEGSRGTYTVVLTTQPTADVTVTVTVPEDTDVGVTGRSPLTLTFTAQTWNVAQTVTVDAAEDADATPDAAVTLTHAVSGEDYGAVTAADVTVTIREDDEPGVTVSPTRLEIPEGSRRSYNVRMATQPTADVTVTATAPQDTDVWLDAADELVKETSLTFAPGNYFRGKVVWVQAAEDDDAVNDPAVWIRHTVRGGDYNEVTASRVRVTIIEDDEAEVSVADASALESAGSMSFRVALNVPSSKRITVRYATSDGTARAGPGQDYIAAMGTVTFAPLATEQTIEVPVLPDALDEDAETFTVTLSSPVNAALGAAAATGTITDDDPEPVLRLTPAAQSESENAASMSFTVELGAASGKTVTVAYATSDGTARAGTDYTERSGTLTFRPGEARTRVIAVPILPDRLDEEDEDFTLTLSAPTNAALGAAAATGTIEDDDAEPVLSIADERLVEADADMVFEVTLSAASGREVTVDYETSDGTATAGADYTERHGTLTFAEGETEKRIPVRILADALDEEETETFTVWLSAPENAVFAGGASIIPATGTIEDDDDPPVLRIADRRLAEADADMVFEVTLDAASGREVTVDYATRDGTGTGAATAGEDYRANRGTLRFAPGDRTKQIAVRILADALDEENETFTVRLSAPTNPDTPLNATLGAAAATGTITDDDAEPVLSIADGSLVEADADMVFTVTLSAASGREVTVQYATSDGTARAARDYTAVPLTPLRFAPGQTEKQIAVRILADALDEDNETFTVRLSGEANATLGDAAATGTIEDDDAEPSLSIADENLAEADADMVFEVTLDAASGREVTVDYATRDGTGTGAATAGDDYRANSGTLTFAPGDRTKEIPVRILADALDEDNETFTVTLSSPVNAALGAAAATGTITDDDPEPVLRLTPAAQSQSESAASMSFTVELGAASGKTVTVAYATSDGTARAGTDYTERSGTLTFRPGEARTRVIAVPILPDRLDEEDEDFTVTLSAPTNAALGAAAATGTIEDDDDEPVLRIADERLVEADADMVFTVELDAATGRAVTVDYATLDGTGTGAATAGEDYRANRGTLVFAPGDRTKQIAVPILADALDEDAEEFTVTLSAPTNPNTPLNATLGAAAATGTITDDDAEPVLSIADGSLVEADADMVFTVTLDAASGRAVTVQYATADGTGAGAATAPADYVAQDAELVFAPGDRTKRIEIPIWEDDRDEEEAETFTVTLSNETNATLGDAEATGTITDDDDPAVAVSFGQASYTVAEGGTATVTVRLNADPERTVIIPLVATPQGDAGEADYSLPASVTFGAGEQEQTFFFTAADDTEDDDDETVELSFGDLPDRVTEGSPATATVAITDDDDPRVTVSFDPASYTVSEGRAVTVTVRLSADPERSVTIPLEATNHGGATAADYSGVPESVAFTNGGPTSRTFDLTATDDDVDDDGETVRLGFGTVSDDRVTAGSPSTVTLTDDDERGVTVSETALNVPESGSRTYTVVLTSEPTAEVTVTVAGASGDVRVSGSPLTFTTGDWSTPQTVTVNAADDADALADPSVTLTHTVSGGDYGSESAADVKVTIVENDAPTLTIDNERAAEGAGDMAFTVALSQATSNEVTVQYATSNGTATAGTDYTSSSGALTFPARTTAAQTIPVPILDDDADDAVEEKTFTVTLSAATDATLAGGGPTLEATGTIVDDDDPQVAVSFGQASYTVAEGGTATVTVRLNADPERTVEIPLVATPQGDAGEADYSVPASVTFTAGEQEQTFLFTATDDTEDDDDETVELSFGDLPVRVTAGSPATATVAITDDDDPRVTVSFAQASYEATEGGSAVTVTVRLSADPERSVTIPLEATNHGGATAADYSGVPESVAFTSGGPTSRTFDLTATDDDVDDDAETVRLGFGTVSDDRVTAGSPSTVTLTDDDQRGVTVTPTALNVPEGGDRTYTVVLTSEPTAPVTIAVEVPSGSEVSVDPASLRFTVVNWKAAQTVTVSAAADDDAVTDDPVRLTHAVIGGDYQGVSAEDVTVAIIETDTPTLTIADRRAGEDIGTMGFEVRLSVASSNVVTVAYETQGGTATAGTDYTRTTGTLRFPENSTTPQTIAVPILDDTVDEAEEETFTVTLSSPQHATLADREATGTIEDNDVPAVTVFFDPTSYEVSEGGAVTVTVRLNADPERRVTVPLVATPQGDASEADYSGVPRSVTFNAGEQARTFLFTAADDTEDDDDETVVLRFGRLPARVTAGSAATATATVAITDTNVPAVAVSFGQASYEASEGGRAVTVRVRLSADPERTVIIPLRATPRNGAGTGDYRVDPARLTFNPTDTRQTFTLTAVDDDVDDDGETVVLGFGTLPPGVRALGRSTTVVTLTDNDARGVTVSPPTLNVPEGGRNTYAVVLASQPTAPVTVSVTVPPGAELSVAPPSVRFPPSAWDREQTFRVTAQEDGDALADDPVRLTHAVSGGDYGAVRAAAAEVTIIENDAPTLTIDDERAAEGAGPIGFTVTLSQASSEEVTVVYETSNGAGAGAATAGEDYEAQRGTLTFPANSTTPQTLAVPILDDDVDEAAEETFAVTLSNAQHATLADREATGTITDDDERGVTVAPTALTLGAGETGRYTVVLTSQPTEAVTVHVTVTPKLSVAPTALTFTAAAWRAPQTVAVTPTAAAAEAVGTDVTLRHAVVGGDYEAHSVTAEDVTVTIAATTRSPPGEGTVSVPAVSVSFGAASYEVIEGEHVSVRVRLSEALQRAVTIPLRATHQAGASAADYSGVPASIIFNSGETEKTFEVTAVDDDVDDDGETVALGFGTLPDKVRSGSPSTAMVNLVDNDDPVVTVSFGQATYEAAEGGRAATVRVRLNADPEREVAIPLMVTPANGATQADYSGVPASIIFNSGETEKTFEVTAVDDDVDDDGETVALGFGTLPDKVRSGSPSTAMVNLVDNDDPVVTVSFGQATYEAAEGGRAATVRVRLNADPEREVAIPLMVTPANGATQADYSGVPASIIFNSGETEKTFEVTAVDDDVDDDGETVALGFGTLPHRINAGGQSTITIIDNDERGVTVSVTELAVPEGGAGTYTVVLHSAPTSPVTIDVTGMANTDVSVNTAQLTFTAENWDAPQEVVVAARDDEDAVTETATLSHAVSGGDYGAVVVTSVVVTIIEDDTPVLTMENQSATEHAGEMVFTVVLNVPSSEEVTVSYATSNGTADAGTDYTAAHGALHVAALQLEQTIRVPIIDDDVEEDPETFKVTLSKPMHATLSEDKATATGTIEDNDAAARALEILLSSVGRMVATDAIDVISRRFDQRSRLRSALTLGGRALMRHHGTRAEQSHVLVVVAHNVMQAFGVDIYTPADLGYAGVLPAWGGHGCADVPARWGEHGCADVPAQWGGALAPGYAMGVAVAQCL